MPPVTQVAIFDLDGTLTWHDTFIGFLAGYARRQGRRWRVLLSPPALLAFGLHRDRGLLKQRLIRLFMRGDSRAGVDAWAGEFAAATLERGMRPQALTVLERHREAGHFLVLLSASPDLYVPRIGALLRMDRVICTEVSYAGDRLDGALLTPNRRGEEKVRCLSALRAEFPQARFSAYGNAASDIAHLALADEALLVNGNSRTRAEAARCHLACADWR